MIEVYYAEDDEMIGKSVKEYLEQQNCKVSVFDRIADAKKALIGHLPTIVLLDWNMPDGQGNELCLWIRERWKTLIIQAGFSSCHTVILAVVREIGNGLDQQLVLAGNHPLIIDSGCLSDHHARIFRTEIPFDGFDVALPLAADDCGHRLCRSDAGIGNAGLKGEAGAAQVLQFVDFAKVEKTGLLRPV